MCPIIADLQNIQQNSLSSPRPAKRAQRTKRTPRGIITHHKSHITKYKIQLYPVLPQSYVVGPHVFFGGGLSHIFYRSLLTCPLPPNRHQWQILGALGLWKQNVAKSEIISYKFAFVGNYRPFRALSAGGEAEYQPDWGVQRCNGDMSSRLASPPGTLLKLFTGRLLRK